MGLRFLETRAVVPEKALLAPVGQTTSEFPTESESTWCKCWVRLPVILYWLSTARIGVGVCGRIAACVYANRVVTVPTRTLCLAESKRSWQSCSGTRTMSAGCKLS
eukprot:688273-Rhodomonas_salina.1